MKCGHYKGKLVTYWFCIGAVFGCGMLFLSVVLLMWMLYKAFKVSSHEQILQPVVREIFIILELRSIDLSQVEHCSNIVQTSNKDLRTLLKV